MKNRPLTKEERSMSDPQTVRDLRRQINQEIETYDESALENLLWKLRQRKG